MAVFFKNWVRCWARFTGSSISQKRWPPNVVGSDLHLYTLPHICAIIFRDVRQATLQLATGRLMPRRRRSRYVFHRRLRLLREGQRRSRVRRVMILSALLIFALPLMAVPAI